MSLSTPDNSSQWCWVSPCPLLRSGGFMAIRLPASCKVLADLEFRHLGLSSPWLLLGASRRPAFRLSACRKPARRHTEIAPQFRRWLLPHSRVTSPWTTNSPLATVTRVVRTPARRRTAPTRASVSPTSLPIASTIPPRRAGRRAMASTLRATSVPPARLGACLRIHLERQDRDRVQWPGNLGRQQPR